jgi:hypothetical protein
MASPAPIGRIDVFTPGRPSRLSFVVGITGIAIVLTAGTIAADPHHFAWPAFAVLLLLVVVLDGLALRGRTWIDGGVLYQRRVATRRVDLVRSEFAELRSDHWGTQLTVRDGNADVCLDLLCLTPPTARSASPAALEQIAVGLADSRALDAVAIGLLRHQARHLLDGGQLQLSPLALCRPGAEDPG